MVPVIMSGEMAGVLLLKQSINYKVALLRDSCE